MKAIARLFWAAKRRVASRSVNENASNEIYCNRRVGLSRKIYAPLFFAVFNVLVSTAEVNAATMPDLITDARKTIVFLGVMNNQNEPIFYATGFLVLIEDIFHLVTAKHVIMKKDGNSVSENAELCIFLNNKNGSLGVRSLNHLKSKYGVSWIFHEDSSVDLAIIPLELNPAVEDFKVLPKDLFMGTERLYETYDVFFLSYQPNLKQVDRIRPIFRSGAISLINDDSSFYIDASAFPGNSGSPVFLKPSPIRFDSTGISIGNDEMGGKFIGIVGEYVTYQEIAISQQTGRPRVVFEENTGLSKVWSTNFIDQIIKSEKFQEQLKAVKARGAAATVPIPFPKVPGSHLVE